MSLGRMFSRRRCVELGKHLVHEHVQLVEHYLSGDLCVMPDERYVFSGKRGIDMTPLLL
jgi:hypothetical protein